MTQAELEAWARRALRGLDPPRAPDTLVPAVLGRIRNRQARPWHRRPWRSWPARLRLACAASVAVLAAIGAVAWPGPGEFDAPALAEAAALCIRLVARGGAFYLALPMCLMALTSGLLVVALARLMGEEVPDHELS